MPWGQGQGQGEGATLDPNLTLTWPQAAVEEVDVSDLLEDVVVQVPHMPHHTHTHKS